MPHVVQMYASLGTQDPCINNFGSLDFCLLQQQKSYSKRDSPPTQQVKPIPLLLHAYNIAQHTGLPSPCATIAYFLLIQPRGYTGLPHPDLNQCQLFVCRIFNFGLATTS